MLIVSCGNNPPEAKTLISAYSGKFLIGAAVNRTQVYGMDTLGINLLKKQFNSITLENGLKWERVHPGPDTYSFDQSDQFVKFGEENNMYLVGHVLVWHNQTPGWVFLDKEGNLTTRDTLLMRMREHIRTVVGRYRGRIDCWDVVNEAIDQEGTMRNSLWYQIIGDDYVARAFEYAREADPEATLIYNDYSLANPDKRKGVIRLIRSLQDQGIRVDGIGMQCHYHLDTPRTDEVEASIVAFSDLGVQVMITELDISVLPRPSGYSGADINDQYAFSKDLDIYPDSLPGSIQSLLAERYADLFRVFTRHDQSISRVTFWGIHDRQSWKNNYPIHGRTDYPLLFDRDYQPKPAFYAVLEVAANTAD